MKPEQSLVRLASSNGYYIDCAGNAEVERLVAKLDALRNGKEKYSVLITSAILGEGKTTVAARTAISAARNWNSPTLLIDFDIRRPRIHKVFKAERENGIVDIFKHNRPLHACLKETSVPNLVILTAGRLEESPLEIFQTEKIRSFFRQVEYHFDNIIVDSPPVIPVSDPLTIARCVDNVLLVVKAGQTSRNAVKRAINMFFDVRIEIGGLVLNNMENVLPSYYDHRNYGYAYYQKIGAEKDAEERD